MGGKPLRHVLSILVFWKKYEPNLKAGGAPEIPWLLNPTLILGQSSVEGGGAT